MTRLDVCVHEAGHAAVGWQVWGIPLSWVSVHTGPPIRAECLLPGDHPRTAQHAQRLATYLAGGRAAVLEGKGRGYLPTAVNPEAGYSVPQGTGCDAYQIHALERAFGIRLENQAKARALEILEQQWPTIRRIAEQLATGLALYSDYLDLLLTVEQTRPVS